MANSDLDRASQKLIDEVKASMIEFQGLGKSFKEAQGDVEEIKKQYKDVIDAVAEMQKKDILSGGTKGNPWEHPEMKELGDFIRTGNMTEFKAKGRMSVNDSRSGGILAPPVFVERVIERLRDMDPIRQYADVMSINGALAQIPVDGEEGEAVWVGENEKRPDTKTATIGIENIQMNAIVAKVPISNDLMDYNVINVEQYAMKKCTEMINRTEGAAFINGNGHKKPEGLFTCKKVEAISKSAVNYDAMVELWEGLPSVVDPNSAFLMNKRTAGILRKLKSTDGIPLWNNPVSAGMPPTFIGFNVILSPSVPDAASGKSPVMFGDLKAYNIIDSMNLSIKRDDITNISTNETLFWFSKSTGGQVTMPYHLKKLTIS